MVGAHLVGILTNKTRWNQGRNRVEKIEFGECQWVVFQNRGSFLFGGGGGGLWGSLYLWSNGWQRSEGVEEWLRVYINQYYKDASGKWKFCEISLVFREGNTPNQYTYRDMMWNKMEQVPRRQFQVNVLKTNTFLNLVGIIVIFRDIQIYIFMFQRYLGKKQFDPYVSNECFNCNNSRNPSSLVNPFFTQPNFHSSGSQHQSI